MNTIAKVFSDLRVIVIVGFILILSVIIQTQNGVIAVSIQNQDRTDKLLRDIASVEYNTLVWTHGIGNQLNLKINDTGIFYDKKTGENLGDLQVNPWFYGSRFKN